MGQTVVITQPTYLPWLGYFEQVARADVFVFLDSVQFARRSWQCRNRIEPMIDGAQRWLTVPLARQPRETAIAEILLSPEHMGWGATHLAAITAHLAHAPYVGEVHELLAPILLAPPPRLADLNIAIIRAISARLGLAPRFVRSSALPATGGKADLMLDILRHLGATEYYVSAGSADYLEAARPAFDAAGISLTYQDWPHPIYPQGDVPFASHLSVVDALAWVGSASVAAMLARAPHALAA